MLALNIALLAFGFLGTVAAIGGDTWVKGAAPVVSRITKRGWIAVACLLATLAIGIVKEVASQRASHTSEEAQASLQDQLIKARAELDSARSELQALRPQVSAIPKRVVVRSWEENPWKRKFQSGTSIAVTKSNCDFIYRDGFQTLNSPTSVFLDYAPGEVVTASFDLRIRKGKPCALELEVIGSEIDFGEEQGDES